MASLPPGGRVTSIDAVREFAVCGILTMNIVAMGMPSYAYVDPHHYGGASGADLIAWAISYVFVDGKMRALFSMLFGASLLIITDAAEDRQPGPARTHYIRMGWLFVFGMLHAWLVWYGDILVEYALCGACAFVARKWPPSAIGYAAALLIGGAVLHDVIAWHDVGLLHGIAIAPDAPAEAVRQWNKVVDATSPHGQAVAEELRLYRGGFADVFAARARMTQLLQIDLLPFTFPETLGFVALGMLLHRLGFWGGAWRGRAYRLVIAAGCLALLFHLPLTGAILTHDFDPAFLPLADAASLFLRPFVALAYAAAIILIVQAGALRPLVGRFVAAGRMALSNYLATSLIMTTIFYGYGLGLFGHVPRAQLYWIALGQWLLILGWSKPWLLHFRYGPFEWAWRSLARGRPQPMSRTTPFATQEQ